VDWAPWQYHVVLVVMLPVCLILSLAIARPNPFSFGGARNETFDPARPGIVRLNRHPLLLALALWSDGPCRAERRSCACDPVRHFHRFRTSWATPDRPSQTARDGQGLARFAPQRSKRRGTPDRCRCCAL
jgi:hypothetical protein